MTGRIMAALAALLLTAGQGLAHSFDVAIVAPLSGAQAAQGQSVLDGFRLATKERDGHPAEESDGHLGGLDVYMKPVDAGLGAEGVVAGIAEAGGADLVLVIDDGLRAALAAQTGAVVFGPGALPAEAERANAASFGPRFAEDFQRPPDLAAAQGYNAARRIELAVRPLGGVADSDALRASLAATAGGIDW